ELPINEPIIEKAFFSLETKKVMEAKKEGKLYGCLYFGYDKSFVLVSHYETEEQELLNLMVDLLCREMGRKHINRVYIVNQREKTDLTSVFDDGELEVKNSNLLSFCTSKWNESRESEEICYVF
ncbi:MAG: hypothetical protein HUK24_01375, partial [Sphaerochaetaceae bacterium]|nr:hypothetical protein [Sphaerochaetaceae bacterium]